MTKKIILTIFVIIALVGTAVYASEAPDLAPTITADDLQNTPLLGTDPDANEVHNNYLKENLTPADMARMPEVGTTGTDIDYAEPAIGNGTEDGIMPINEESADRGEVVTGDTFISEDAIDVADKQFDGNVFLVGAKANLASSAVYGDLFVLSQATNLQNIDVIGNIYIAAQSATLNTVNCSGNVYIAGSAISLSGTAAQDVFIAGSAIVLDNDSYILRNLYAGGASITIGSAQIGRNANLAANDIQIAENAIVNGNLNKDITPEEVKNETRTIGDSITSVVITAISALAICGFIFLFGKGFIEKQKSDNIAGFFLKNLGMGILFTIVIPVVATLLLLTGLATGLSFIIIFIYIIIFAISTSIVSVAITANITKNMEYNSWRFYGISILVAIVIGILKQIPMVNFVVTLIVAFTGMGLIFSSLKTKKENKEVVTTTEE